jgi:uncharacterized membrane protein YhfC
MGQVPTSSLIAMGVTLAVCFGVPILLWVIFAKKMGKGVSSAVLAGALGFFVPQAILRIPALQLLGTFQAYQDFARDHFWTFAFLLAATAGLFETVGRLVVFRTVLKKRVTYYSGLCAGLGHGGIEAAYLIGLTYVNNLVLAFMINAGTAETVLAGQGVTGDQAAAIIAAMTGTPAAEFYAAGFERVFTISFHIGMSLLLAYGITKGATGKYFVMVLGLHTLLDFSVLAGQKLGMGLVGIESFVALAGIAAAVFAWKMRDRFPQRDIPRDEAELAVEQGY